MNNKNKRRGFSLLDVLLALAVSAVMYANIAQLQNDMGNNLHAQATADRMTMLAEAGRAYIAENYKTLTSMATNPIEVPIVNNTNWAGIGDLQSSGLLPDTFTTNMPFGQTVHFLVRSIPANGNIPQHLEGMLITDGGNPMDDRQIGLAMAKMGGNGGGIMKSPPPGVLTSNIQGSFASWSQPISTWSASGITAKTGHVAYDVTSIGSPVTEWLNRYDTGNPEANRMHTNIDMNNNNLLNTKEISGEGNNDIQMGDGSHTGRVDMQNGGIACQGNQSNCHFDISDDGGFYDHNDSWIEFQGQYAGGGLKVAGSGGNLDVKGQTVTEAGVMTSDNMGVSWSSNPSVNGSVDASATYANGWVSISGGSGFQGVNSEIFEATKFQDKNNTEYYVIPSGTSNLDQATFSGNIATNGLALNGGYPTGWTGGVHTWDLYAESSIGVGENGTLLAYLDNKGHIEGVTERLSSTLDVDGKVTENSDVEMINGNENIDKGDLNIKNGNEFIEAGSLDVSENNNVNGGSIFTQNSLTVGRNIRGQTGNGGNFVLRGNEFVTGAIKFDYGLTDGAGSPDGSGGFAGGGGNCTTSSTGPGSIDFDVAKNAFYICTADNTWHRVLTDQDKN